MVEKVRDVATDHARQLLIIISSKEHSKAADKRKSISYLQGIMIEINDRSMHPLPITVDVTVLIVGTQFSCSVKGGRRISHKSRNVRTSFVILTF